MSTQQTDMGDPGSLPVITPATYEAVRKMMQEEGIELRDKEQVSEYVEKLIAREKFFRTADRVREGLADIESDQLQSMIDEAVEEEKASRRE